MDGCTHGKIISLRLCGGIKKSVGKIQFYLLLSPYLCFISLLYLDLCVLGDDALIS